MKYIVLSIILFCLTLHVFGQKNIDQNRIIEPYLIEVTYNKTVHILFPSQVKYVDLGSPQLIAAKADGVQNVVRIKSSVQGFSQETNFSVITEDGGFFSFIARYSDEPKQLSIDMGRVANSQALPDENNYVQLSKIGEASPLEVAQRMAFIHKNNRSDIRNIGSRHFAMELLLKGIYIEEELYFLHLSICNRSGVTYDVDHIRFRILDKKISKRTVIQQSIVEPVTLLKELTKIYSQSCERSVFVFKKFTIPDNKVVVMDLFEKNGGRHLSLTIRNIDLIHARTFTK